MAEIVNAFSFSFLAVCRLSDLKILRCLMSLVVDGTPFFPIGHKWEISVRNFSIFAFLEIFY